MKRIPIIAILLSGALLASSSALAQGTPKKKGNEAQGPRIERQIERMSKELDLTDAQKPKIKALFEETAKKRQEISTDTTAQRERRAKLQALIADQDKKMKAILTPQQFEKYEKQRNEMREKAKNKAPGGKKKQQQQQ